MVLLDLGEFRLQDLESILFAHHGTAQRPHCAGGYYRRGPGTGGLKSVFFRQTPKLADCVCTTKKLRLRARPGEINWLDPL
jgi:hypothetical protein